MITTATSWRLVVMSTIKKIGSVASGSFFWFIISCLCCRLPFNCWERHQQLTDEEGLRAPAMFPSATELEEFGVEFKRKEATSFLDVTFRDGVMEIPFLSVDDNTALQFRNLIAYEQCCPTSGDYFTSYATLLGNLINTPKDVAILKKCGIIETMPARDGEVADLFNSLCKGAYLNLEKHYLAQLFENLSKCYEVGRHRQRERLWRERRWRARRRWWWATLMNDYFGTPWSTISVIAAIILLILTVVQAIYAILAYHKPPK